MAWLSGEPSPKAKEEETPTLTKNRSREALKNALHMALARRSEEARATLPSSFMSNMQMHARHVDAYRFSFIHPDENANMCADFSSRP